MRPSAAIAWFLSVVAGLRRSPAKTLAALVATARAPAASASPP
jgi:hypothetical protein